MVFWSMLICRTLMILENETEVIVAQRVNINA